jgi:hypothetical protein
MPAGNIDGGAPVGMTFHSCGLAAGAAEMEIRD